jgi:hypothetical protein
MQNSKEEYSASTCPRCGLILKRRDKKKYGFLLIIFVLVSIPLELVIFKSMSPILNIIGICLGIYLLTNRDRFFYFCKHCKIVFSKEIKEKA